MRRCSQENTRDFGAVIRTASIETVGFVEDEGRAQSAPLSTAGRRRLPRTCRMLVAEILTAKQAGAFVRAFGPRQQWYTRKAQETCEGNILPLGVRSKWASKLTIERPWLAAVAY
jgi:hypothetical protein